jgi:hypothetical protein
LIGEYFDTAALIDILRSGLPAFKFHQLATVLTTMVLTEKGFPRPDAEVVATDSSTSSAG